MALFSKMDRPIFLKEESDSVAYIERLEELKESATGDIYAKIEKEIKLTSIGQFGENNIAFELKNSGMPMYIIRDLHIEVDDLSAQIDFVLVTRKLVILIECKNLIGDIEIDSSDNFIRTYEYNKKKFREGIYSPITQNARHLDILKLARKDNIKNVITKFAFEKVFYSFNKSIVVLANPKTILNDKHAKKETKDKVIRADQLVKYIKNLNKNSKESSSSDKDMLNIANILLELHTSKKSDYAKRYEKMIESKSSEVTVSKALSLSKTKFTEEKISSFVSEEVSSSDSGQKKLHEELVIKLKKYRLDQSRVEKIKPYIIFSNKEMNELIEKMPKNKEELILISGFGPVKTEKYANDIISILWNEAL